MRQDMAMLLRLQIQILMPASRCPVPLFLCQYIRFTFLLLLMGVISLVWLPPPRDRALADCSRDSGDVGTPVIILSVTDRTRVELQPLEFIAEPQSKVASFYSRTHQTLSIKKH